MKIYVVIELYEACRYGGAYANVELFKSKEKAEQYVEEMKNFAVCEIVEKEIK